MNRPYIPHASLKGDIITDWSGPCEVLAHARFPVALPDAAHLAMLQGKSAWVSCFLSLDACAGEALPRRNVCLDRGQNFSFDPSRCRMRLDPRRPEVAHRIADLLRSKGHEAGHLLPVALGGRQGDVTAYEPCERCESAGGTCYRCREGSEMDRPPRRTIPAADVSAVLLAASVAGVELGRGVVRGVLGEWRKVRNDDPDTGATWVRHRLFDSHNEASGLWVCSKLQAWRTLGWQNSCESGVNTIWQEGPETGPEGRVAADAAASRLGYALLDPASPFGVVAPTFDLENER